MVCFWGFLCVRVSRRQLFEKWVPRALELKRRDVSELVPTTPFNAIISLCNLFEVGSNAVSCLPGAFA